MRPIDAKVIEDFDGAKLKITRVNGPLDTDAAYIRGYNAGMQFIVNEAKKAPTITPKPCALFRAGKKLNQDIAVPRVKRTPLATLADSRCFQDIARIAEQGWRT